MKAVIDHVGTTLYIPPSCSEAKQDAIYPLALHQCMSFANPSSCLDVSGSIALVADFFDFR